MAKSSYKPRLGWLMLAVVLLLHARHDQPSFASAGETDGDGASQHPADVKGQKAGLRGQGIEATLGEAATDADFSTVQSATGNDKNSAVLNDDEVNAKGQPVPGKFHARGTRRARTACRIVAAVLVLAILGRSLVFSGRARLRKELRRLQKLEALMPVAEKLCATVGTPQSRQLFSAVEALLPEIRQALSEAEAKLKEQSRFRIPFSEKPYEETISSLQDIRSRTCKAITALHTNARYELTVSKKINGKKHSAVGSFKGQLERLVGADYANAFIMFAESQEAAVDDILQAYKKVVFRSNARPVFAKHRDGHLLVATIRDLEVADRLASARDAAQKFLERLESKAFELLERTVRQHMRNVIHEHQLLIKGLKTFVEYVHGSKDSQVERHIKQAEDFLENKITVALRNLDTCKTLEDVLEQYGRFCGAADEASKLLSRAKDQLIRGPQIAIKTLHKAVSDQLEEIAEHAQSMARESLESQDALDRDFFMCLGNISYCMKATNTFSQSQLKLDGSVRAAIEACKRLHEEKKIQYTTDELLNRLMLAIDEDSKARKAIETLFGNRANVHLVWIMDDAIAMSVKTINELGAKHASPTTASEKFIATQKKSMMKDLGALKKTESLSTIAETAARLRKAAHLVQLAAYEGAVPQG
ncbi:hypothetical protein Emed_004595 [Eimeria media]